MSYVIAASKDWYREMVSNLSRRINSDFYFIGDKVMLNQEYLDSIDAKKIFFPHWSYIIPPAIYEKYECIIFHMTDVPFGRGGSPLQNLLAQGIYETKISALCCVKEVDAGPVYLKKPLSLYGTAQEIYLRASKIVEEMIVSIILDHPEPQGQEGKPVRFRRRGEQDGNLTGLTGLEQIYDFIRMLDAEGYPKAFLETQHFRFEFSRASLKPGHILADVIIRSKSHAK